MLLQVCHFAIFVAFRVTDEKNVCVSVSASSFY